MANLSRIWKAAILLSLAASLSFLGRTFLDFRFVYPEIGLTVPSLSIATFLNLAFFTGWIWALILASHSSRKAMYTLLVFDVLLLLFGISTLITFCPSPCPTGWPLGEILIWSNLLIGVSAIAFAVIALRRNP